jgi:hypothetical protein
MAFDLAALGAGFGGQNFASGCYGFSQENPAVQNGDAFLINAYRVQVDGADLVVTSSKLGNAD